MGLCDNLLGLKVASTKNDYVPKKGAFIMLVWTRDKNVTTVDEEIKWDWNPLWHEVDKEFEVNLCQKPKLHQLMGHMFYV